MTWPTKTDFVDGNVLTAAQMNNIGTNLNLADPTGITDGYVLTADGAGSMGWEAVAAGGWTLINSGTLSGTEITSSTFSGYNQIHIDLMSATTSAAANPAIRLNGLSTGIYGRFLISNGPTYPSYSLSTSDTAFTMNVQALSATAYSMAIDVYNASQTTGFKVITANTSTKLATTNSNTIGHGYADIAAAITSVTIRSGGTWTGGNYYIWGLK